MAAAELLMPNPGERVLDLCAAPGGKTTHIAAKMQNTGLLLANENVERMGLKNTVVTNETPERLAGRFPGFFDRILVDAPCSGEGMFRKDENAPAEWSPENVQRCAARQRDILEYADQMLRPGGCMVYSTCTFSELENEGSVDHFLKEHPAFHLAEIPWYEGFCPGRPDLVGSAFPLEKCVRLFPHKIDGEGHFLALLAKDGELRENRPEECSDKKKIRKLPPELSAFLEDVKLPFERSGIQVQDTKVFWMPEGIGRCPGLRFLRSGLYMGELLKKRFEPSQAFAMALKKEEYASVIDLPATDERVIRYLKGETIEIGAGESGRDTGWQLVCVDGYPLGWGKLLGGTLRNKYFSGWRMNA